MPNLLVTGASGFLGWNLCQIAIADWTVYGTYSTHPIALPGVTPIQVDLTDTTAVRQLWQTVRPDAIVHLAALSQPNLCEQNPEASTNLNVTAACVIADRCADTDIPCAFASSEMVFNGLHAPYREDDPVSPINLYGEQKAQAEVEMLQRYPKTAVCRLPLMFGAVPPHASSFLQPFIQALRTGQELKLFVDEIRTPVSGTTAAQGLLLALQHVQGRIHLGGKEPISRYDFGCLMADVLSLPKNTIRACRQQDVPMAANRPPDLSLDSRAAFALGYTPPSLEAELEALKGKV